MKDCLPPRRNHGLMRSECVGLWAVVLLIIVILWMIWLALIPLPAPPLP